MTVVACGEAYVGPLSDKPVHSQTASDGRVLITTLRDHVRISRVPERALDLAFTFFDQNRSQIQNQNWLSIIDFTLHSSLPRLFVINLNGGDVDELFVAHGEGSDPENTGFAHRFSNEIGSLMSSLGFFLVNESYTGRWGYSARLDGLEERNFNARERAVVLHGADYVGPNRERQGLSQGCPAVELKWIPGLIERLEGRSLLYAYLEGMD